jgi:thioredoxin-like negative regulator of GroEL
MEFPMRKHLLTAAAILLCAGNALAADPQPYNHSAFVAAQAADKPILVEIHAPWCPICAAQQPTLDRLEHSAELGDLTVFRVDFDSQKDVVRGFGAQMQSTLIVFHGDAEKGRSTGVTDPKAIEQLLLKSKT